jgi:hypothetical protein
LKDGLYKVEFRTPLGMGAGVVVLQGGQVRGGDSRTYYVGSYSESSSQFSAKVKVDTHTNFPGLSSVFGRDRVNISLRGREWARLAHPVQCRRLCMPPRKALAL